MSSLIANKVKINMYLVSIKFFIVHPVLCATVQTYNMYTTIITTITTPSLCLSAFTTFLQATLVRYSSHTTIRYSAHNLFVSTNIYSLDLYSKELPTMTVPFTRNVSLHKTD